MDAGQARRRLEAEYAALSGLARFGRVLLWFEHDLWDQAALIRVLGLLAGRAPLEGRLALVPADGRRPFAALADAELGALVPAPLTRLQAEAGAEAWAAFAAPDPRPLDALRRQALPLPHLAVALRRHLQDLPWTTDGLTLTERLVLRAIARGASDLRSLLAAMLAADPVFHVTDLIVKEHVARLSGGAHPPIARGTPWHLAPWGQGLLRGEVRHGPAPRFQGGVTVGPRGLWRWDPALDAVAESL